MNIILIRPSHLIMKSISMRLIPVVGLTILSTLAASPLFAAEPAPPSEIPRPNDVAAAAGAFRRPQSLDIVDPTNSKEPQVFEFGVFRLTRALELDPMERGIRHIFRLKNSSSDSITISGFNNSCGCVEAAAFDKQEKPFPVTVQAGQEVKVLVTLHPTMLSPGPVAIDVDLFGKSGAKPLAVLTVKGSIDGGISFSQSKLDFGDVLFSAGESREVKLHLDRYIPLVMPRGKLLLQSTNPAIHVALVQPDKPIKDVAVTRDSVFFSSTRVRELPQDVYLTVRVGLSKDAPIGDLGGKIKMVVPGFPLYLLVRNTSVQVSSVIKGHMDIDPQVIVFGAVRKGESSNATAILTLRSPVLLNDIESKSSNEYVSVQLRQLSPEHDAGQLDIGQADRDKSNGTAALVGAQAGSSPGDAIRVEAAFVLSDQAPVGKQDAKITLTNRHNREYLQVMTYGVVNDSNVPRR